MNATLHLPSLRPTRRVTNRPVQWVHVFAAILITLRGLHGPNEESADDPAANYDIQHKYGGAGD